MSAPSTAGAAPPSVASPFIGRAEQLDLAVRRWDAAINGDGHFLLVAGEAGIGKSRLLAEISGRLSGARKLSASVFPRDTEAAGGLIVDLSSALAQRGELSVARSLREPLAAPRSPQGDSSRARRTLVSDVAALVLQLLREQPTLLSIEDLHWADELSLDILERVASELRGASSLVIATYRSDELYPHTPLRRLRSRLVQQRLVEELRLPRLDARQTEQLARSLGAETASADTIRNVVDRSDGIPLYIEELLATDGDEIPETIADAISARVAELGASTISILEAAAVIGRFFDVDLLVTATAASSGQVDAALQELEQRNLIRSSRDGSNLDFRHALIRDVVYEGIPPLRKRELHAAVASAALTAGFSDAYLSDQFERARNSAAAHRYALSAAADARRLSSNREAVELLLRVLRTFPSESPPNARASVHAELAEVLAAIDSNRAAAENLETAIRIFREIDDEISVARLIPQLAAVRHLLGEGYEARVALIDDELTLLDARAADVPIQVRVGLLSALSAAYMLDRCLDDAFDAGAAAAQLASTGDFPLDRLDVDITLGAIAAFAGRTEEGWSRLESAVRMARENGFEALAARAYRMMGSCASMLVDYPRAIQWIGEGIDYSRSAERWNDFHYLQSHAAHVLWATGDWRASQELADLVLADDQGGITTRHTALLVRGYLAMGMGELSSARALLEEARGIGERMAELQRLVPALWGLAECELIGGSPALAVEIVEYASTKSEPAGDAAYIYCAVVTGVRAYAQQRDLAGARHWLDRGRSLLDYRAIPGTMPAIGHAQGLLLLAEGRPAEARPHLEEAVRRWDALGRFWDANRARIDLASCAARSRLPRVAAELVAEVRGRAAAVNATALVNLAEQVPLRGQSVGPLSLRELEVARLVASGATNREIAERLTISPKTASSHVEHILAKLGVARRAEIAAWVSRQD